MCRDRKKNNAWKIAIHGGRRGFSAEIAVDVIVSNRLWDVWPLLRVINDVVFSGLQLYFREIGLKLEKQNCQKMCVWHNEIIPFGALMFLYFIHEAVQRQIFIPGHIKYATSLIDER